MDLVLPGLAVLGAAAIGFRNGAPFAPVSAMSIPMGLAVASLASARLRASAGVSRSAKVSVGRAIEKIAAGAIAARTPEPRARLATIAEALEVPKSNHEAGLERGRDEGRGGACDPPAEVRVDSVIARIRLSMADLLGRISSNADRLASATRQLASEVAESARHAKSAREATGASAEMARRVASVSGTLNASLEAIESQISGARRAVIDATRTTEASSRVIDGLASKASEIGEIIGLIQAIAARTNLLALNATLEAARAGEAGRGFAAVARDVKALAHQAERASGHIAERIAALQRAATGAVEAVATIDATMRQAEELTGIVALEMRKQVETTREFLGDASRAALQSDLAIGAVEDLGDDLGRAEAAITELRVAAIGTLARAETLRSALDELGVDAHAPSA
jgi:methyl-accepting chemotaxis protein